jgi:hypothetical protein
LPKTLCRLTKAQLDGACGDDRFDQDFFIDLIFADVQTEGDGATPAHSEGVALNEEDRQAYEDMLHRDEAFWVDIEARKERLQKQREEQMKKRKEREAARLAEEAAAAAAAADAAAAAAANAEAEAQQLKKAQATSKTSSFSIEADDEPSDKKKVSRRGSWNEEKDKELMSELESLTSGALAKVANDESLLRGDLEEKALLPSTSTADSAALDQESVVGLAKEFEDIKKLEAELGLESFSNNLSPTNLDLLDAELEGLGGLSPTAGAGAKSSKKRGKDDEDVLNFDADDFDELEEYLSGLSSK